MFGAHAIYIARATGDNGNGGGFNPANVNFATDLTATLANTAAPVVASASTNFVTDDIGHYLFIQGGINWLPGFYPITAIIGVTAVINATIGAGFTFDGFEAGVATTVAGIAITASPTGGVWGIDYSRSDAIRIFYADITSSGATYTSAVQPVTKKIIGNYLNVFAGTNFTVQRVEVVSTSGFTATVDKSLGVSTGGDGTAGLGGALATSLKAIELLLSEFTVNGTFNIKRYIRGSNTEYSEAVESASTANQQISFPLGSAITMNDKFIIGQTAISSTVPTQITDQICKNGLQIKNLPSNDIIYIGHSDITALVGYPLAPGETIVVPINHTNLLRALAVTNSQKLAWIVI